MFERFKKDIEPLRKRMELATSIGVANLGDKINYIKQSYLNCIDEMIARDKANIDFISKHGDSVIDADTYMSSKYSNINYLQRERKKIEEYE